MWTEDMETSVEICGTYVSMEVEGHATYSR